MPVLEKILLNVEGANNRVISIPGFGSFRLERGRVYPYTSSVQAVAFRQQPSSDKKTTFKVNLSPSIVAKQNTIGFSNSWEIEGTPLLTGSDLFQGTRIGFLFKDNSINPVWQFSDGSKAGIGRCNPSFEQRWCTLHHVYVQRVGNVTSLHVQAQGDQFQVANVGGEAVLLNNGSGSKILTPNSVLYNFQVGDLVTVTLQSASVQPTMAVFPTSLDFPETILDETTLLEVEITNTGSVDLIITNIQFGDPAFSRTTSTPIPTIRAGRTETITIAFTPTEVNSYNSALTIVSNANNSPQVVPVAGTSKFDDETQPLLKTTQGDFLIYTDGTPEALSVRMTPVSDRVFSTSGSQIYFLDETNTLIPHRFKGVSWRGMESADKALQGLQLRNWKSVLDNLKGQGFDLLRFPLSTPFMESGSVPAPQTISYALNPDLEGLTCLSILDRLLDYCAEIGLSVILDHHRNFITGTINDEGGPVVPGHIYEDWEEFWVKLAQRYGSHVAVVGADLHNEPWDTPYNEWADLCERMGNRIHTFAPDWLILVQGCKSEEGTSPWRGSNLSWVRTRPISLARPNKIVYAPHEFGHSVDLKEWLKTSASSNEPANWPENLVPIWENYWGFIAKEGIAPVMLGEVGGRFGVNDSGANNLPYAALEQQWFERLADYINMRNFDPETEFPSSTESRLAMSWIWWGLAPGLEAGGLLQSDWITPISIKYDLIELIPSSIRYSSSEDLTSKILTTEAGLSLATENNVPIALENGTT